MRLAARVEKPEDKFEPSNELEEVAYDFWGSYWDEIVQANRKGGGGIYGFISGMIPDLAQSSDLDPDRLFSTILDVGKQEGWISVGRKHLELREREGRTMRRRLAVTKDEAIAIGEDIGIDWDEVSFDPEDLVAGIKVELEHGSKVDERVNITKDDLDMTAQIAWAHLMEDPDYYIMLDEMEGEFDGERTPELREKEGRTMRHPWHRRFAAHGYDTPDVDQFFRYLGNNYSINEIKNAMKNSAALKTIFRQWADRYAFFQLIEGRRLTQEGHVLFEDIEERFDAALTSAANQLIP